MFEVVRERITREMLGIKMWVESIPSDGSNPDFQTSSYGLFFVYIYGVYESIIKQIIGITINELNQSGVGIASCIYELYSVLLSNEYDSLYQIGNDKKWEKRWVISQKLACNHTITIPTDLFPTDGRNIKIHQLESLNNSFGIDKPVLPRQDIGHYIQEMVEHRNHIAHGDVLPKEVGRRYTKTDILNCCSIITEICNYICDTYEEYIVQRKYLRPV
ncbi:MAG: MAE_28990/MAE_18760 family HEPN-like nuclease [Clostridia bacterium]|nr:MAE_28990/MAE_18760 family HEPN-like nuclease [Clostridia bacterium]